MSSWTISSAVYTYSFLSTVSYDNLITFFDLVYVREQDTFIWRRVPRQDQVALTSRCVRQICTRTQA